MLCSKSEQKDQTSQQKVQDLEFTAPPEPVTESKSRHTQPGRAFARPTAPCRMVSGTQASSSVYFMEDAIRIMMTARHTGDQSGSYACSQKHNRGKDGSVSFCYWWETSSASFSFFCFHRKEIPTGRPNSPRKPNRRSPINMETSVIMGCSPNWVPTIFGST